MDDPLRPLGGKQLLDGGPVGEIDAVEAETRELLELGKARFLERHVIVGVEIVETDDLVAELDEALGAMEANESGRAGHQQLHAVVSSCWRERG